MIISQKILTMVSVQINTSQPMASLKDPTWGPCCFQFLLTIYVIHWIVTD